ncbi:hypothetical protein SHKM778_28340 [Streptomyces sp. KM77-8]|uniref:Uncharacterized protein n=1 Tax=Streptomyces haneummycinicus TaxID=3074435 RepID=A0AAT9HG36_9ACTN
MRKATGKVAASAKLIPSGMRRTAVAGVVAWEARAAGTSPQTRSPGFRFRTPPHGAYDAGAVGAEAAADGAVLDGFGRQQAVGPHGVAVVEGDGPHLEGHFARSGFGGLGLPPDQAAAQAGFAGLQEVRRTGGDGGWFVGRVLYLPGDEAAPGGEDDLVLLAGRGEEFHGETAGVGGRVPGAVAGQAAQGQVGALVGQGAAGRPDRGVGRMGRRLGSGEESGRAGDEPDLGTGTAVEVVAGCGKGTQGRRAAGGPLDGVVRAGFGEQQDDVRGGSGGQGGKPVGCGDDGGLAKVGGQGPRGRRLGVVLHGDHPGAGRLRRLGVRSGLSVRRRVEYGAVVGAGPRHAGEAASLQQRCPPLAGQDAGRRAQGVVGALPEVVGRAGQQGLERGVMGFGGQQVSAGGQYGAQPAQGGGEVGGGVQRVAREDEVEAARGRPWPIRSASGSRMRRSTKSWAANRCSARVRTPAVAAVQV